MKNPPPSQPSPTGEGDPFPLGGNKKGGKKEQYLKIMKMRKELYKTGSG